MHFTTLYKTYGFSRDVPHLTQNVARYEFQNGFYPEKWKILNNMKNQRSFQYFLGLVDKVLFLITIQFPASGSTKFVDGYQSFSKGKYHKKRILVVFSYEFYFQMTKKYTNH